MSWLSLVLAGMILAGCAKVGPDYVRPDVPLSKDWHTQQRGNLTAGERDPKMLTAWWTALEDPILSSLIERAIAGNLDLKKARARIREARARRGVARADLFPTIDATTTGSRSRGSEVTGPVTTTDLYTLGFDAGWELDVFGGARRSVEAAEATLQASREDWRDVLVSLLAEVALNYIDVRTYQARLAVAEANLASQDETCRLTSWRYQAGLSDELAVQQARYNLENTRS
ncbi:MAG: TolC family protein, partial [Syntrophales bacterium]|nr:TolC family protein [Syntrophales bacterium]